MALLNLAKNLVNVGNSGVRVAKNRVVSAVRRRYIQGSSKQDAQACDKAKEAVKQGVNEAKHASENMKSKTDATACQANQKAKEMSGKAQNAWETAKEKAQKAKDSVLRKAEESKEAIKENAEKVKKNMKD